MPLAMALLYTLGFSVLALDDSADLANEDPLPERIQLKFRDLVAKRSSSL